MSIIKVIRELHPDLSRMAIYEMSSQGPLFEFLRRYARDLTCSEYFDNVAPGKYRGQVQCQDVQHLTYPDAAFDLCTSTDVFEHVADDNKGFREICRVLRPGARFVLTVPLSDSSHTVERAELVDGMILHHKAPEYHGDAIRGYGRVLCFRNYGRDVTQRLIQCGFSAARIVPLQEPRWWGFGRNVIVADK
jgi:SAM-dependent methyltransferase